LSDDRVTSESYPANASTAELERLRDEVARLQRLEEGWRRALDGSNQAAWSFDVVREEFLCCSNWRRIRGIPDDEVLQMDTVHWIETVHPEDRSHVLQALEDQNSGRKAFSVFQYREMHRSGRWIWIESRGSIMEWQPDGKAARVVGTDADITDRKHSEQKLEDLSRKLNLAIEVAEIGLFEADLINGQVVRDRRLLEMYGASEDEPLLDAGGTLQRRHLHPDDRDNCMARIADGIASGMPFGNQFRIITSSGEIRHIRSRSVAFKDQDGRQKLLGVNWNVTGDVKAQEELKRAVAEAEARAFALEQARETIRQIAVRDELTGLLNRRGLNDQLEAWDKGAVNFSAVLHLDLDYFKEINDEFGHHTGDFVLKEAARRLQNVTTESDIVARWGGDEFVILTAPGATRSAVMEMAQAAVRSFHEPVEIDEVKRIIGVSVGTAFAKTNDNPAQLLVEADQALYRAKARGRGRAETGKRIYAKASH
jgi:diguanylate cyclase (GGDEF)-like protein/PAS domain S-box-containing protein